MAVAEQKRRRWFRRPKSEIVEAKSAEGIRFGSEVSSAISYWWPLQMAPMYGANVEEAQTGDYGALYVRQEAVRTVVDFLAMNMAPLNIKTFRKSAGAPLELPDHPAQVLLQNPNPDMTRYQMIHATVSALAVYENAFWWLMRVGNNRQIRFLPPSIVRVLGNPWVGPTGYRVRPRLMNDQREEFTLSPDEVVHFRSWNPMDMRLGLSKLEGLRSILADDALAQAARAATWRNAAFIQNVVERPLDAPELTGENLERHRQDWQNQFGGAANAGKTVFAEEGETMNWGPDRRPWDTEFVAGRKFTLEEVARAYHIPLSMIGLVANGAAVRTSEERQTLYADVLDSWMVMIEQQLRHSYLPWFDDIEGVYFKFNIKEKLRGSFTEEADALAKALGRPWMSLDEGRALQELPPAGPGQGGDQIIVPMNVSVGGQPNPQTPTETPAGPLFGASIRPREKAATKSAVVRRASAREHQAALDAFFGRQARVILSRTGAKAAIDEVFDDERWNRELRLDLLPLAMRTARAAGQATARRLGGAYDEAFTVHWLEENVRIAAEGINATTRTQVEEALGDPDALKNVFEVLAPARAVQSALTRATNVTSFATEEAARQNGRASKMWVVTSGAKSRHPELGGEETGIGEAFSNGAQYPGDASLPVEQAAGCLCLLEIG